MKESIIIGAGGQARVIISNLLDLGHQNLLGVIDIDGASNTSMQQKEFIIGLPVIGNFDDLLRGFNLKHFDFYLAIGDINKRYSLFLELKSHGGHFPNLVSKYAIVDKTAKLGSGNIICHQALIGPETILGDNNLVNTGALIEHESSVGSHCHLAPKSSLAGRVSIGSEVFIGLGATVINNIHVADKTTVGAGAVVIRNIENIGETYVGIPAKKLNTSISDVS